MAKIAFPAESHDLENVGPVLIRTAKPSDVLQIRWLYNLVYEGNYPFSLVDNPQECLAAIESENYLWLVGEAQGKIIASIIFVIDSTIRIGKAFGAVVAREYRNADLAEMMLSLGLNSITCESKIAMSVYSTTRTVSLAPQRLAEKVGFKKLGIFPNVHRVNKSETHTLAVYYEPSALQKRSTLPELPSALQPFFSLACRETGIAQATYQDLPLDTESPKGSNIDFEMIQARQFVLRRLRAAKASGRLVLDFFPFHEPNLLPVSPDGKTEIYLHRSTRDGHCVLIGAFFDNMPLSVVLEQGAAFLEKMGIRYLEILHGGEQRAPHP